MPRYSFGSRTKMSSSSSSSSSSTSSSRRRSPRRTRSTPKPASKTVPESASASASSKKTSLKSAPSTPASVLRSSRYKIPVQRTKKGEDGYADDSPYWDAVGRAVGKEGEGKGGENTKENGITDNNISNRRENSKSQAAKDVKKRQKREKKVADMKKLKEKYEREQQSSAMKPNFKVGAGTGTGDDSSHNGEGSDNNGRESSDWLKKKLLRKNGHGSSTAGIFSPSDLSYAPTIPPTPASVKSPLENQAYTPLNIGMSSSQDEDDDFYNTAAYPPPIEEAEKKMQEEQEPQNRNGEPRKSLSPVREDYLVHEKAKNIETMDVQEIENDIEDVVEKTALKPNGGDGGDDDGGDGDGGASSEKEETAVLTGNDGGDVGGDDGGDVGSDDGINEGGNDGGDNDDDSEKKEVVANEVQGRGQEETKKDVNIQLQDNYSDGDDDNDGAGFELAEDYNSPPASPELSPTKPPAASSPSPQPPSSPQASPTLSPSPQRSPTEESVEKSPELEEDDYEGDDRNTNDNDDASESSSEAKQKSAKKRRKLVEFATPIEQKSTTNGKNKKNKKNKKKRKTLPTRGYQAGNREYTTVPLSEFEDEDEYENDKSVRRSKRRKFRPLEYWRNEKVVYEKNREKGYLADVYGDMPMVAGIQQAEPTPYKKRNVRKVTTNSRDDHDDDDSGDRRKGKKQKFGSRRKEEMEPFDSSKLRKKYKIEDGDSVPIWWDSKGISLEKKVVCYKESVKMHSLPLTKKRKKSDGKVVAKAAQTIYVDPQSDNMPGYICGRMEIPPLGIKDEEGVGPCSQVFNVGECQPKSVELAIADPDVNGGNFDAKTARRFMLSDGDEFHIPAGNVYRLQNHSTSCSCVLNWVIIRPLPREED